MIYHVYGYTGDTSIAFNITCFVKKRTCIIALEDEDRKMIKVPVTIFFETFFYYPTPFLKMNSDLSLPSFTCSPSLSCCGQASTLRI